MGGSETGCSSAQAAAASEQEDTKVSTLMAVMGGSSQLSPTAASDILRRHGWNMDQAVAALVDNVEDEVGTLISADVVRRFMSSCLLVCVLCEIHPMLTPFHLKRRRIRKRTIMSLQ